MASLRFYFHLAEEKTVGGNSRFLLSDGKNLLDWATR